MMNKADTPASRRKRVRIRQIGGDDGYQWCLLVDGRVAYSGMQQREASWRRSRFIDEGVL